MTSPLLTQPITTLDLTVHALTRDLDRLVFVGVDGTKVTAGALAEEISRHQQYFESLEPRPASAAVLSRNRLEVIYVANGLSFAGAVQTALHPMGTIEDFLYVIEDAQIDTLVFDAAQFAETARQLAERAPRLKRLLAMGDGGEVGTDLFAESSSFAPQRLTAAPLAFPAQRSPSQRPTRRKLRPSRVTLP